MKKTRNDMKNILYAINNKLVSAEEKIAEFEHIKYETENKRLKIMSRASIKMCSLLVAQYSCNCTQ